MTVAVAHTSAIATRHIRTFIRQPWWIAISLIQPVIYLLLFSQLFQTVGSLPAFNGSYLDFLLPGVVAMSALSTGGWAGTTSIEDMDRGVMGRMLVTPASRTAIILGHFAQGGLIVVIQALILVGLGIVMGATFNGGRASRSCSSPRPCSAHRRAVARARAPRSEPGDADRGVAGDHPAADLPVDHVHGPQAHARLDGHGRGL